MDASKILMAAALLPAAFLLLYIYRKDSIEKESPGLLLKLFLFGILSCIPASFLEQLGSSFLEARMTADTLEYNILYAFGIVGLAEEGMKYLFLKRLTWRSPEFNYRFDGIVYAVFVSLGFAAFENVLYVFNYGLSVAVSRAILAIPGHMGFAVYMGSFYGQARQACIRRQTVKCRWNLFVSLLLAVLLHGFYDCCLFLNTDLTSSVFFGFVIVMYIITIRYINHQARNDHNLFL